MASMTSIHGSPIGAFKHDLRERDVYKNEDIIKEASWKNYSLSDHGRSSRECMTYYEALLSNVYHREGSTVTTAEWSIQAPPDLSPEKEEAFFQSAYDFLNHYNFGGDDTRCLLAVVHRDEIGAPHLHYVFTFPETENPKYVAPQDKFIAGMKQAAEKYDLSFTREYLQQCFDILHRYENRIDAHRERDAIQELGQLLDLKRDDARWVFTRIRRLESERYEMKLMSKDSFLDKNYFDRFHPAFQQWMDEHGFNCTVFKGGGGISLTVEQLKELTRQTGKTLDKGLSVDFLSRLINENSRLLEHVNDLQKQIDKSHEQIWGHVSGWDRSKEVAEEWTR